MECERKYNERDREKDGEMERKKRKVCLFTSGSNPSVNEMGGRRRGRIGGRER